MMRELASGRHPDRTFATVDHIIPTDTRQRALQGRPGGADEVALADNCKQFGI